MEGGVLGILGYCVDNVLSIYLLDIPSFLPLYCLNHAYISVPTVQDIFTAHEEIKNKKQIII